jgi:hypothetical protein
MSRITGSDAKKLMEAYTSIYTPQEEVELTEEQVQEDFENWVNSLVEEGHDLSEHTWEEMYETYLSEIPINPAGNVRAISNAPYQSRFARPMNAGTPQRTGRATAVSRPQIGSLPSSARQVTQYPQGVSTGVGGGNAAASRQTPAARPAASVAKPATSAARPAARPATTSSNVPTSARTSYAGATGVKPVGTPLPTNAVQPVAGAPAQPMSRMAQQTAELRKMRQASQQRQIAQGGTPATPLVQSFDPFDVVMGHLIDEGYADTEEAALQIMANMSEEWRQSIVEAKQEEGKSKEEKQKIRTERSGFTGPHANNERRGAHQEKDERNKDLADLRKGKKKNSSYFSYLP